MITQGGGHVKIVSGLDGQGQLAQRAIDDATAGDTGMIERLLKMMQRPYDEQPEFDDLAGRRPDWARNKPGCSALSCSS